MQAQNYLLNSNQFIQQYQSITDFYNHNIIKHFISTNDNFTLSAIELKPSVCNTNKTLVIIPGRGEVEFKYAELLYSIKDLGIHAFVLFVRGQGHSQATLPLSRATYIDDFSLYRKDVATMINKLNINPNFQMLAFSLGGLISIDYLQNELIKPQRLAIIAPFLYPYFPLPSFILNKVIKIGNKLFKTHYAPHHGEYQRIPFEKNVHSHCRIRYEKYHDYYSANKDVLPGGITYGFLSACLKTQYNLMNSNFEFFCPIHCQIAEKDKIVNSNATKIFISKHLTNFFKPHLGIIDNAYHDILNEEDHIRNPALYKAFTFLFKE